MSSSSGSTVEQSSYHSRGLCGEKFGKRGNWSGMNIAVMVLGFVLFWPAGLGILFWIASGHNVAELPQAIRRLWMKIRGFDSWSIDCGFDSSARSDNVVFDEYQQTQYDRIREIKDEIKERARRFNDYRSDAKRRADEEEFNRFMADAPVPDTN